MNWTCPYCHRDQTITDPKLSSRFAYLDVNDLVLDRVGVIAKAIGCANRDCRELTLEVSLVKAVLSNHQYQQDYSVEPLKTWLLMPDSNAKPQPDYIPQQIRDDYREACLIRDLSPKASATLARRCLQGMIRDFGKVTPSTLFKEIAALEAGVLDGSAPRDVSEDSIGALTSLRKIGNIGAHMEGDVNLVVPVEPAEAGALIELIEVLLDEWYVERHKRTQRFAAVNLIEQGKAKLIADAKAAKAAPAPDENTPPAT